MKLLESSSLFEAESLSARPDLPEPQEAEVAANTAAAGVPDFVCVLAAELERVLPSLIGYSRNLTQSLGTKDELHLEAVKILKTAVWANTIARGLVRELGQHETQRDTTRRKATRPSHRCS